MIPPAFVEKFRKIYVSFMLPLVRNLFDEMPRENIDRLISAIETNPGSQPSIFADRRNPPLNIFHYSLHLSGTHALD